MCYNISMKSSGTGIPNSGVQSIALLACPAFHTNYAENTSGLPPNNARRVMMTSRRVGGG